jgi:Flp pilus assembly protein TadD
MQKLRVFEMQRQRQNESLTPLGFVVFAFLVGCSSDHVVHEKASRSMVKVAQKARNNGNPEAATNFYKKAIGIDPNNSLGYLGLAECFIDANLLDAAISNIKQAESKAGCNMRHALYLRGKIHLISGDPKKAEAFFLKSRSVDSLNALGAIYDERGEHAKAQKLYRKVIELDSGYIEAYNNLGLSLMLCDRYGDAVFYLENACSLPGANASHRSNLALAYGLSGNIGKAREIYAQDFEGAALEDKVAYVQDLLAAK